MASDIRLRLATEQDIPTILAFIQGLAEYEKLSDAEYQRLFQIRKGKTTRPEGGTRSYPQDSRSVSSTLTDPSSARKRSAAAANLKSDQSDDNASLFSDSDQDMMTDKRSRNRANARQTPP